MDKRVLMNDEVAKMRAFLNDARVGCLDEGTPSRQATNADKRELKNWDAKIY
ncbi:hypothetical protein [Chloroherpeton thalassium]|uniref:hypothetical protein n=1 Tax=Chloroherpeton thalassium TaxID=100716 RepID=UPI00030F36C6|nr:hypothetical protein [Chloroherpeton thalassium]